MAGYRRVMNVYYLLVEIIKKEVPGDFVECGVWRGGISIFARAVLDFHNSDRISWLFDSFKGLPPASLAQDRHDVYDKQK